MEGMIFNIQRMSVHDGPGIRTTVFLKGCSLRCFWCHNPESLCSEPQLQTYFGRCINCGKCYEICPVKAHQLKNGERRFLRELCTGCGLCAELCYAEAIVLTGEKITSESLLKEIIKDKDYYENSGGGVTFSGGEPLLQIEFLKEVLIECKKQGIHTAVDTAGNVPWSNFEAIVPLVDLFLFDIKVLEEEKHKKATGVSNKNILNNLCSLCESKADIWIRVPVIPGVNDNINEMEKIAEVISKKSSIKLIELLPFHSLGESKYESLGMNYEARDLNTPYELLMSELTEVFLSREIRAKYSK